MDSTFDRHISCGGVSIISEANCQVKDIEPLIWLPLEAATTLLLAMSRAVISYTLYQLWLPHRKWPERT